MGTRLYVGNLSYNTVDEQLRHTFSEFGTVLSAQVVTDRQSGQSRGFGFVEFESGTDAQRAIDTLNGTALDGRNLNVNEARERSGGGGGGFRRR